MAYENLCMYCFEDMGGETICPHCGRDSRAAVPQIQMLPGSLVYHDRFLIGRALGQDATGIVYSAFDTKRENKLRLREYLPRDCAERLNDGSVVPIAGMEDQFEAGLKKLRASVESVEDPRKRHFFFEENGTAYIAQRKFAGSGGDGHQDETDEPENNTRKIIIIVGIAVAAVLVAAIIIISLVNGALNSGKDVTQSPTLDPNQVWVPEESPTPTPYATPTFAALVDPDLSWMDYTYDGDVEQEYQEQQQNATTPTPKPTLSNNNSGYTTINSNSSSSDIKKLQQKLVTLGWLSYTNITGSYDSATRQAVKDFQTYVNQHFSPSTKLDVDGIAGPKTLQWLYETNAERPTASPTPAVTPGKDDEYVVDENSSAREIRDVQRKLIFLGVMPEGSDDGIYGATTATAVRQFQKRVNQLQGYQVLDVSGKMDALSLAFLDYYVEEWQKRPTPTPNHTATPTPAPTPTDNPNEDGETINADSAPESIRRVQQMLIAIGMLPEGADDGRYGSATISAVADFQEWVNEQRGQHVLDVTGECDVNTLNYLEYCEGNNMRPNGTPTASPTGTPTQTPTQSPTPEPTEDANEGGDVTVDENSDPESIRFVQSMLHQVGFLDEGAVDGVFGSGTTEALRQFQQWVNEQRGEDTLAVTGKFDEATRQYLEYCVDHEITAGGTTPTEAPTQEPTSEPTDEPQAGAIEDVQIAVGDVVAGSDVIEVSEGRFTVQWRATGDVDCYYVYVEDADGNSIIANEAIEETSFNVNTNLMTPGMVYTFTLGVLPVNGTEDDIVWKKTQFMLPAQATEAPTQEPEPTKGSVSDLSINVGGVAAGSSTIVVEEESFQLSWSASGDVDSYAFQIKDAQGNVITEQTNTQQTGMSVKASAMTPGVVYTLTVGVLPVNGGKDDIVWAHAQFMLPAQATEAPTPEPAPAEVGKPSITVDGSAYQEDGISYITGESIILSWNASGEVESYTVYVENQAGERVDLGTMTETSRTVSTSRLPAGIYTVYVGAMPVGGSEEDVVWGSSRFGIPAPTQAPTEEPTQAPDTKEPGTDPTQAPEAYEPIDSSASAETIQQLQMRLYSLGLLSTDGLEPGVLDQMTLQAVADFQSQMNEQNGTTLVVIDPTDPNAVIDVETLKLLFG